MKCEKDCGIVSIMNNKCECFNNEQKILYTQPYRRFPGTELLYGNKKFIEQFTKALKESGILK